MNLLVIGMGNNVVYNLQDGLTWKDAEALLRNDFTGYKPENFSATLTSQTIDGARRMVYTTMTNRTPLVGSMVVTLTQTKLSGAVDLLTVDVETLGWQEMYPILATAYAEAKDANDAEMLQLLDTTSNMTRWTKPHRHAALKNVQKLLISRSKPVQSTQSVVSDEGLKQLEAVLKRVTDALDGVEARLTEIEVRLGIFTESSIKAIAESEV